MGWQYNYAQVRPPQNEISAPRNHLLCSFFLSFVLAAEIAALEVLAISVFHAAAPPETFLRI
jgi:hypothetical protein